MGKVEGEFSTYYKVEGKTYWDYDALVYPPVMRTKFTLPSDSTFREDLIWLKKAEEEIAQKLKETIEEIQRHDKKLREKNKK